MTTADQNKQELIDWLLAYAKKRDIMVELVEVNPTYPSISLKNYRFAVINTNWHH